MYDVILVGTDGSDSANRAVEHALELGARNDATVHAISVVDTRRYGEPSLSSTELVINELEARANDLLSGVRERGEAENVAVETRCCHGNPPDEIVAYADDVDADLLLLGYQGQTHSADHMGSVANRVVRSTDRAVLLA